jgi:hypothetical protein
MPRPASATSRFAVSARSGGRGAPGGGWFLAGTFTTIGGKARAGLAGTTATGAVGGWNPKPKGGRVTAMALSPMAPSCTSRAPSSIAATPRMGFAALTTADLHLTSWPPVA